MEQKYYFQLRMMKTKMQPSNPVMCYVKWQERDVTIRRNITQTEIIEKLCRFTYRTVLFGLSYYKRLQDI